MKEKDSRSLRKVKSGMFDDTVVIGNWECFLDDSYFHMWCVRRHESKDFNKTIHVVNKKSAENLIELLNIADRMHEDLKDRNYTDATEKWEELTK